MAYTKELNEVQDYIWFDEEEKMIYYENENGDLVRYIEANWGHEESEVSNYHIFYEDGLPFILDYNKSMDKPKLYDHTNIEELNDCELVYELNKADGCYDYGNEGEHFIILEDIQYDIVPMSDYLYFVEEQGNVEWIKPQFNQEEDTLYYTLLLEACSKEWSEKFIDNYVAKMQNNKED